MKRNIYITLFTLLGILVSFIIHAAIEIPMIALLVKDYGTYGLGLSWNMWEMIHNIGSIILLLLGIYFGFRAGKHYWTVIYKK